MKPFAFVFPGQGSQSVGMLDAWGDHPAVKQTLQEASEVLHQDIGKLISSGSKEELALTTNTQPVMLTAGIAAYRAWLADGHEKPHIVAGHSLGEYSALVASGALTLTQALPLVRFRAQAMQEAVPVGAGAMGAILGMASDDVVRICQEVSANLKGKFNPEFSNIPAVVEAVNFNDPLQTVIAGEKTAVYAAFEALKSAGAKRALPLPVSAPFHSSLMAPAALRLKEQLAATTFHPPALTVINNIDVQTPVEAAAISDALYRQAFGPVRWVQCIVAIQKSGIEHVIECGPGKVLMGLSKRIDARLVTGAVFDPTSLQETVQLLS